MRQFINIAICSLAAFLLGSCESGGGNTTAGLLLNPSAKSITANGTDKVNFTVTKDGADVTSDAEIFQIEANNQQQKIEGASFSTRKNGDYTFQARYNGEFSPAITIKASGETSVVEKYYRNVCIFKLTGSWCTNCPPAGRIVDDMVNREFKDRLIVMSFHGSASGYEADPMTIPETNVIFKLFPTVAGSYPSFVADMRQETVCTGITPIREVLTTGIKRSLADYPATCGIRVESAAADGKLNIKVGVTSNTGGSYKIGVYVMENHIVYRQYDAGLWYEDFKHHHVVRQMLSKSVEGDLLGSLSPDVEKLQEYSVDIKDEWKLENLQIGVYAIDETGTINNVVLCNANNGKLDYRLK